VRRGQRHHQADAALEAAAEPDASDRGAGEEDHRGPQGHGHDGHGHAGDQGQDADQHHRPGRGPAQHDDGDDGRGGQHEQAQAAQHHVAEPVSACTSAGPSAPYRPASAHTANSTGTAVSTGRRSARGRVISGRRLASARCPADRLAHRGDGGRLQGEHADQGQVDEWVGSGRKRTASADTIAPLALPMPGATALANVPSSRSMSSMAAPIAPRRGR